MKYNIGIFGSAAEHAREVEVKALALGRALGKYKKEIILVTGACAGIPQIVAVQANRHGVEIWGYSAGLDLPDHKKVYPDVDNSIFAKLFFVPKQFPFPKNHAITRKYRNIISTANCDAGIIVSGRWGTLNEFTDLVDYGKLIGVYSGTGGVADELSRLTEKIKKQGSGRVIFNSSAVDLVEDLLTSLKHPSA